MPVTTGNTVLNTGFDDQASLWCLHKLAVLQHSLSLRTRYCLVCFNRVAFTTVGVTTAVQRKCRPAPGHVMVWSENPLSSWLRADTITESVTDYCE
jgi:hypothetical protein